MDFVSDALFNGKRFRTLTVMDQFTRECLAIYADQHIKSEQVVTLMQQLCTVRRVPRRIQTDKGSEFVSRALDRWAYEHQVTMDFSVLVALPITLSSNRSTVHSEVRA